MSLVTGLFFLVLLLKRGLRWRSGKSAALLVGRSRDRFPVVSLDFSGTYSFRPYHGPGVDSAPSENEYQEHFLEVKAAGAWDWQPHHLYVPNVMKSGSLNLLEHSGPHRACYATPLPYGHCLMRRDGADLASNYNIHEFYAGQFFLPELKIGKFKLQET